MATNVANIIIAWGKVSAKQKMKEKKEYEITHAKLNSAQAKYHAIIDDKAFTSSSSSCASIVPIFENRKCYLRAPTSHRMAYNPSSESNILYDRQRHGP